MEENAAKTTTAAPASRPSARPAGRENAADEIDLLELFMAVRRRILLVLLCGLIGANAAALVTRFVLSPQYTSTSKMLVLTKETTISSLADLQIGSQLTNDYTILIQSRPVLQETIDNLNLPMDYKALRKQLSIANPNQSRILEISITDQDPQQAKKIVDDLSNVAADYISEKMEVTRPNIIEEGEIPLTKSSPSMSRNVLMGLLIGALLAIASVCIGQIMNDAIMDEEDVERYLGLSTLAMVPDKEQATSSGKKNRKKINRKAGRRILPGGRKK